MLSPSVWRGPLATVLSPGVVLSFVLGAAAVVSVITAAPAAAHADLVRITPETDARLTKAPTEVVLEFGEPVSRTFASVVVITAAGASVTRGKPTVMGAKVTQPLRPDITSGSYRVGYRVVSDDGHPLSGESTFTLTPRSGSTTSVESPGSSTSPLPAPPSRLAMVPPTVNGARSELRGWPGRFLVPVTGAVALLGIGAGALLWNRQRR